MTGNILLSKVVSNSDETSWSQAYSTLNLYIALSISKETTDKPIASIGKETLEKLQREFFVIDNKTLETIKQAVQNVVDSLNDLSYSIVLTTIINNSLYIVIAGEGTVVIKRGERIGEVAKGDGKVTTFSGPLESGDIFIIETGDFSKKIAIDKLSELIVGSDLTAISENIAPHIHENSSGTEAAILIQYLADEGKEKKEEPITQDEEKEVILPPEPIFPNEKKNFSLLKFPKISFSLPKISLKFKKTYLIIFLIVVLIIAFIFTLKNEQARKEDAAREKILNEILLRSNKKFSDGESLESLNVNLALDAYKESKDILEKGKDKIPSGTKQEKTLEQELSKVNKRISDLGGEAESLEKKVFDKNISVTTSRDNLSGIDNNGNLYVFDSEGNLSKTISTKIKNPISISSDDKNYYILTQDSIYLIDQDGKTQKISNNTSKSNSIDNFAGNIYTLSPEEDDVLKFSGENYSKSSYFTSEELFTPKPSWFTIDSSVWIILSDGNIKKYTRGKEDTFSIKTLPSKLGAKLQIYTSSDLGDLYILDIENARIVSLSKSGEFKKSYSLSKNPTSFSIDNSGKKAYFVANDNLYSIDL